MMVKRLSDHEITPEQSGPGNGQVVDPAFADVSDLEATSWSIVVLVRSQ